MIAWHLWENNISKYTELNIVLTDCVASFKQ